MRYQMVRGIPVTNAAITTTSATIINPLGFSLVLATTNACNIHNNYIRSQVKYYHSLQSWSRRPPELEANRRGKPVMTVWREQSVDDCTGLHSWEYLVGTQRSLAVMQHDYHILLITGATTYLSGDWIAWSCTTGYWVRNFIAMNLLVSWQGWWL